MPSPVGHLLGGLVVAVALAPVESAPAPQTGRRLRPLRAPLSILAAGAIAACLPDIDFLWGRHNMETHSVGFAALLGAGAWLWRRDARLAAVCALAAASHTILDWLGSDGTPPIGVMAWWPFSREFYFAHAYVFQTIWRQYWLPGFVAHNALAVAREIVILGSLLALAAWLRTRRAA